MIKNAWNFQHGILSLVRFILKCRQEEEQKEVAFFLTSHIAPANIFSNDFQKYFGNFKNMRALTSRNKKWKLLQRHIIRWGVFLSIIRPAKRLLKTCMRLVRLPRESTAQTGLAETVLLKSWSLGD